MRSLFFGMLWCKEFSLRSQESEMICEGPVSRSVVVLVAQTQLRHRTVSLSTGSPCRDASSLRHLGGLRFTRYAASETPLEQICVSTPMPPSPRLYEETPGSVLDFCRSDPVLWVQGVFPVSMCPRLQARVRLINAELPCTCFSDVQSWTLNIPLVWRMKNHMSSAVARI
jgi:hypothetical protein